MVPFQIKKAGAHRSCLRHTPARISQLSLRVRPPSTVAADSVIYPIRYAIESRPADVRRRTRLGRYRLRTPSRNISQSNKIPGQSGPVHFGERLGPQKRMSFLAPSTAPRARMLREARPYSAFSRQNAKSLVALHHAWSKPLPLAVTPTSPPYRPRSAYRPRGCQGAAIGRRAGGATGATFTRRRFHRWASACSWASCSVG